MAGLVIMAGLLIGPALHSASAPPAPITPAACPSAMPPTAWAPSTTASNWTNTTWSAKYSAAQLATMVLACEETLEASPALTNGVAKNYPAFLRSELALITLDYLKPRFENINMMTSTAGPGHSTAAIMANGFFRLGIPPFSLQDGPNGDTYRLPAAAYANNPLRLPSELALAASMDPRVANSFGTTLGSELATGGYNAAQAPDLNIDRIPNWGRSAETFGEDPTLTGLLGAADESGILSQLPMVTLKHFGVYGQETTRHTLSQSVSTTALYNDYLRPFAIALATPIPAGHAVSIMCAYGDLNGKRQCVSPQIGSALAAFNFNGVVRTDLDVVASTPTLLNGFDSVVKPEDVDGLLATFTRNSPTAQTLANVHRAALAVLTMMFQAGLVGNPGNPMYDLARSDFSNVKPLSDAQEANDLATANSLESRGAVLLVNRPGAAQLPLRASSSNITIFANQELATTCRALATSLSSSQRSASCDVYDAAPNRNLVPALANWTHVGTVANSPATTGPAVQYQYVWTAPTTGPYLISLGTTGKTALTVTTLHGNSLEVLPGSQTILPVGVGTIAQTSTLSATANTQYVFRVYYGAAQPQPTFTLQSLVGQVGAAAIRATASTAAIVLAQDNNIEGVDRSSLNLPWGQDAVITKISAVTPTSVLLMTTGPVVMPWINATSLNSVMELWNQAGNRSLDVSAASFVPAITALLNGSIAPSGRLPLTFPTSADASPMWQGKVTTSSTATFWPGTSSGVNLTLPPDNGAVVGYSWYHAAGWGVLFPFGYGLTYPNATFPTATLTRLSGDSASCTTSARALCLSLNLAVNNSTHSTGSVPVYVSPTPASGSPVHIQVATVVPYTCSQSCTVTAAAPVVNFGSWSTATNSYQFLPGCYRFVAGTDEATALSAMSATKPPNGLVVSDTYSTTTGWGLNLFPNGNCR